MTQQLNTPAEPVTYQSASIAKLLPALIAARAEFRPLLKDADNPFFGSKYSTLAAVLEACDAALGRHDLGILQIPVWDGTALILHSTLCHTSGEWIRATYPVQADIRQPQLTGAGLTYARRYSYLAVAGIAPEDDDGETASGRGNGRILADRPPPAPPARRNPAAPEIRRDDPRPPGRSSNGNGHQRPAPPAATSTDGTPRVPVSGGGLWRWAAEIERERGPGLVTHLMEYGRRLGWPAKIVSWTPEQAKDAHADALEVLESIYGADPDPRDYYEVHPDSPGPIGSRFD